MGKKHGACEGLRCLIKSKCAQAPVVAQGKHDIIEAGVTRPDDAVESCGLSPY